MCKLSLVHLMLKLHDTLPWFSCLKAGCILLSPLLVEWIVLFVVSISSFFCCKRWREEILDPRWSRLKLEYFFPWESGDPYLVSCITCHSWFKKSLQIEQTIPHIWLWRWNVLIGLKFVWQRQAKIRMMPRWVYWKCFAAFARRNG